MDLKKEFERITKLMNDVMDKPLKDGLMNKSTHDEYKKDLNKYVELLAAGRDVEAKSYFAKLIEKYK